MVWVLVGLAVLLAVAFLAGWMLPATREGRAEAMIAATPARILAVISDVAAQPEWREGVQSVERTDRGWVEVTTRGERITFEAVEMTKARVHLRFRSDLGYFGEWLGVMMPEGSGTRMAVTESATVQAPLKRLIARMMFDAKAFAAEYLAALKARSEGP
jgi:hypothetical protein